MNIVMTGVDHEHADIALRERLSFVKGQVGALLGKIGAHPEVAGCVLISTCNRTELYLSCEGVARPDPAALLCAAAGADVRAFEDAFRTRADEEAARHLVEVACGLRSQILGEDQIVSQVKQAAALAHEAGASDPVLETLFRCAVTAGKEVRTETRLAAVPLSAAHRGVALAARTLGELTGRKAVVIGNGEMGRLAAELLAGRGAHVTVTLRSYRHGETVVPRGCRTQPYDDRMQVIEGADLVVSATTSPHYTLTADQLRALDKPPRLVIDLALPRDVEPAAAALTDVRNMDDLGRLEEARPEDHAEALRIVQKYVTRFYEWADFRAALPVIEQLKEAAFTRVWNGEDDEDTVRSAVEKTVDLLLGGMKGAVTPARLRGALDKIESRQGRRPVGHSIKTN